MSDFQPYIDHGWQLCAISSGSKGPNSPGWNDRENAIKSSEGLVSAGLLHAYSGTAALDIDDGAKAVEWLKANGIDLYALMKAPDAVKISSGTPNRGKLLYALETPLPSKTFANGAFELRCGTASGKSVQDVLPPSLHPSGRAYQWVGDWRKLPALPAPLLSLWGAAANTESPVIRTDNPDRVLGPEIKAVLDALDPNCGYDEWIRVGMALHHETQGSQGGLIFWDTWSAPGKAYKGFADLESHWRSFGNSATPVTLDSIRKAPIATIEDFAESPELNLFTPTPNKFTIPRLTLAELYARPAPPWIIPGVLPQARLGCIYGPYSSGKTFLACDLALSIALGRDWRGKPVKQGHALYIAAEDNYGVQARIYAAEQARGVSGSPLTVIPAAPSFLDPDWQKALLEAATRPELPSVIFVDTLARVTAGADENSGKDMGPVLEFADMLAEQTGALVILIHHTGKDANKGMRGWSGMPANMDVIWAASKEEGKHEVRIEKLKNAEDGMAYGFRLLPMGGSCVVEWL